MRITKWLPTHTPGDWPQQDVTTGARHGYVRWPDGTPPTPYGCRRCGTEQRGHGWRFLRGRGLHVWERPTDAQILARMQARRAAFKSICRCVHPVEQQPGAPVVDPWRCEADECVMHDYLIGLWLAPLPSAQVHELPEGGEVR